MKHLLFLSCLLMALSLFAQNSMQPVEIFKIKTKLNSTLGTIWGGSTASFRIESFTVPDNAVACYYSFTTSADSASLAELNFVAKLGAKIAEGYIDPTHGVLSTAIGNQLINGINIPAGAMVINSCFLDATNAGIFMKKPSAAMPLPQGFKTGTRQDLELVTLPPGTWFVGLQNLDIHRAVYVDIEIVAIVMDNNNSYSQQTPNNTTVPWLEGDKKTIRDYLESSTVNLFANDNEQQQAMACTENVIFAQTSANEIRTMSIADAKKNIVIPALYKCVRQIFKKSAEQEKAENLANAGWKLYLTGDLDGCINYMKQALVYDKDLGWAEAELALCLWINGNQNGALAFYTDALEDIKDMHLKTSVKANIAKALIDINNALAKYPDMLQPTDIINMYQSELANYQATVPLFSN